MLRVGADVSTALGNRDVLRVEVPKVSTIWLWFSLSCLMTLSSSIRVLLPTALQSDRISDHDVYRTQPCLALESQALFQLPRGDEGPGYVALRSTGLARADDFFPKKLILRVGSLLCRHT